MLNQGKILKLNEVMNLLLKQYGIENKLRETEVANVWAEVVGGMIASKTKSLYIKNGKLFVSFTSSVVRNELSMVREGVIAALNAKVGEGVVKELIIH
ncbi:MAG: DUF721 domain-containing protein [Culturomica sp.]|jgi:predicted nucleic acid-binding Zn ribbon protein|nr:DUF721 domain-containing protein [Culturomica sp.]